MNNQCEATFRITTPMFIGGGDKKASEVRPSSVKGALRFWWRALNWAQHAKAHSGDEAAALRALHAEEARLFGLAAGAERGGQGVFLLSVLQHKVERAEQPFTDMSQAQLYLLGMGLGGNHALRNALSGGEFSVRLLFRPRCDAADKQSVLDALYLFGLLGSLGSRARHGMGSVSLSKWQADARGAPANRTDYLAALRSLLSQTAPQAGAALPPFTAFSPLARIDLSAHGKDPLALLTLVGSEQQFYRSFGQNGKVQGKSAERNFTADHDLIYDATLGKPVSQAPARAVFGLPHNYFFSSSKAKADVNYAPNRADARRASPLLLHIHALGDTDYLAVHALLPARFLPDGEQIRIKAQRTYMVDAKVDWKVLTTYLDRFKERETAHG
ncbi:type III-B CRISPR module RAMP protein Cmr1 [Laribacter hongkongensis]|uniref:type III-B CRISPR module RAMP protein Cmr1 n=1 Tax=Laribacter hongkongensis TaxID=168471 RepID=UPI001EFCBCE9|nr:type III-B CRISPR module RAMP protein Cmr1 [Laribacter hongkongensis]MCG9059805.1 type III-B CRISPR module RAMP protein Cmr1 [Laribacter hongkongensis]MCG9084146.1 type III-B CRISPR module RAMP protein Cmr1 [Laribacter hongkongensis]MCG9086545.1 type III-B CRISPR module RAMP protein Cmr1 [Laribacter hongkongensis]